MVIFSPWLCISRRRGRLTGRREAGTVEVGKVPRMRLEDDAQAVGTLRSNQSVVLRPEVSGRIVQLAFTDGQRVRRGQLLLQLVVTLPLPHPLVAAAEPLQVSERSPQGCQAYPVAARHVEQELKIRLEE